MREYDVNVTEAFRRGLSPEEKMARGFAREFLFDIAGLKPTAVGLRPGDTLTSLVSATWPFPQIMQTYFGNFAFFEEEVCPLSTTYVVLDPLDLVDFDDPTAVATIDEGGGPWHGTELLQGGLFTNGQQLLVMDRSEEIIAQPVRYRLSDRAVSTVATFNGRTLYGGFTPASMWTVDWRTQFEHLLPDTWHDTGDVTAAYVFWSSIGGGDSLWPLRPPELGEWLDIFERNEAGFAPMPWNGSVLRLLPLGSGVVAYGDKGIAFLAPITTPATTFGILPIAPFGIASRCAAFGNKQQHVFVNSSNELFSLSAYRELRRLGYRDCFDDGEEFLVSYDSNDNDFYITGLYAEGEVQSYIFTPQGLGKSLQVPTSILEDGAALQSADDVYYYAATEIQDFGFRDVKTVTMLEVGTTSAQQVEVAVDYRYETNATFRRSPWIPLSPDGFGRPQVTALEFRICVRAAVVSNANFELDYVNVRWQPCGRRTTRGITSAAETVS